MNQEYLAKSPEAATSPFETYQYEKLTLEGKLQTTIGWNSIAGSARAIAKAAAHNLLDKEQVDELHGSLRSLLSSLSKVPPLEKAGDSRVQDAGEKRTMGQDQMAMDMWVKEFVLLSQELEGLELFNLGARSEQKWWAKKDAIHS